MLSFLMFSRGIKREQWEEKGQTSKWRLGLNEIVGRYFLLLEKLENANS